MFWYNHQKNKNRKPDPGPTGNFYGWTRMSIQLCLHWNFPKMPSPYIRIRKIGNRTENRNPDHRENFMCKWTSLSKEISLHKKLFDMTIRSTKTGNRTDNRTPDKPEIFMNEPVWEYPFACIRIFSIGPTIKKL